MNLGTAGAYVALFPDGPAGPKLLLQRVGEPKAVKNRMHFDIEVADIDAEAEPPRRARRRPTSADALAASTAPRGCS